MEAELMLYARFLMIVGTAGVVGLLLVLFLRWLIPKPSHRALPGLPWSDDPKGN
jgi:hypothetical protein